jgi:hypothetical protein
VLLFEAHVHLYPCFELEDLLSAAHRHFSDACARRRGEGFAGLLLLTESSGQAAFESLRERADAGGGNGAWRFARTGEPDSLRAEGAQGERLFLVAGSQIVSAEGLEVHALATAERFPDGAPAARCLSDARDAGAIAALPWGVGKWWGRRGRVLADLIATDPGPLWLGDNGGRPWLWARPRHFGLAARRGFGRLGGTDPLPFAREAGRVGSFGSVSSARFDASAPAASMRRLLAHPGFAPEPYGSLAGAIRFARDQLALRRA